MFLSMSKFCNNIGPTLSSPHLEVKIRQNIFQLAHQHWHPKFKFPWVKSLPYQTNSLQEESPYKQRLEEAENKKKKKKPKKEATTKRRLQNHAPKK
jgi:hypothetical protein